jgi:arginyl-tRNA--protein-N-Asp/Glu arginylyltransferase
MAPIFPSLIPNSFQVRTIGQPSPELEADLDEEFELFKKYQIQIHKDKEGELSLNSFTRFLSASPLISEKQPAGGRRKKVSC